MACGGCNMYLDGLDGLDQKIVQLPHDPLAHQGHQGPAAVSPGPLAKLKKPGLSPGNQICN